MCRHRAESEATTLRAYAQRAVSTEGEHLLVNVPFWLIRGLSRFGVILVLNKIVNCNTAKLGKINTNRRIETGLGSPRGQARQISRGSR